MFRANSDRRPYSSNRDDDDDDDSSNHMSEMLQSLSEDYYTQLHKKAATSSSASRAGSGEAGDVNDNPGAVGDVDDDDEPEAIGDADQEVDLDFRDAVEQKWAKIMKTGDIEDEEDDYFDLFKLVTTDPNKSSRFVDPRRWQVNVTVSKNGSSNSKKSATATGTKNRAQTTIEKMMSNSNSVAAATAVSKQEKEQKDKQQQQQQQQQDRINNNNNNNNNKKNDDDDDDKEECGMGAKSETFTIEISPEEGAEMFLEEIEACKIVYGEENVVIEENIDEKSRMMTVKLQVLSPTDLEEAEEKRNRKSKGLWIAFVKPVRYPLAPLEPFIEPGCHIFTFQELQLIYKAMVETSESNKNTPCLFNMVQTATSLSSTLIAEGCNIIDESKKDYIAEQMKAAGFNVRLAHEKLTPSFFIGSISKVLGKLPRGFDVMYVENVMRVDLAKRFEAMQRHLFKTHVAPKIAKTLANTGQNLQNNATTTGGDVDGDKTNSSTNILKTNPALAALCDSRAVFHGTRNAFIDNIVSKGLKVPEKAKNSEVKVRVGSRYGVGIYSTPLAPLALCYAENGRRNEYSVKLIVCAVLQGLPNIILDGEEPWGGGLIDPDEKGYNSHESEDGSQIVVFNAAQILPCYCLHLMERRTRLASDVADLGRGNKTDEIEREMKRIEEEYGITSRYNELDEKAKRGGLSTNKKKVGMHALAEAERKKILTALARKNLPFGFGPAGEGFVVEEIAPYSDDDEDLDEYVGMDYSGQEAYEEFQQSREADTTVNSKQKFDPFNVGRK